MRRNLFPIANGPIFPKIVRLTGVSRKHTISNKSEECALPMCVLLPILLTVIFLQIRICCWKCLVSIEFERGILLWCRFKKIDPTAASGSEVCENQTSRLFRRGVGSPICECVLREHLILSLGLENMKSVGCNGQPTRNKKRGEIWSTTPPIILPHT